MDRDRIPRRAFCGGLASLAAGSAAGCLGGVTGSGNGNGDGAESTREPGPRIDDGKRLSAAFPIELVPPDAGEFDGHSSRSVRIASVHWHGEDAVGTHWHKAPLEVPLDGTRTVRVRYLDSDREELPLGEDEAYQVDVELADGPDDLLGIAVDGNLVEFQGRTAGEGELLFHHLREGETAWTSPPLEVVVANGG